MVLKGSLLTYTKAEQKQNRLTVLSSEYLQTHFRLISMKPFLHRQSKLPKLLTHSVLLSGQGFERKRHSSKSAQIENKELTLIVQVPELTNINFLLTISIHNLEKSLYEWIKWSPGRKRFDLLTNSLHYFKEMYENQSGGIGCRYWGLNGEKVTIHKPKLHSFSYWFPHPQKIVHLANK